MPSPFSVPFILFFLFYITVSGVLPLTMHLPLSVGYLMGFYGLSNKLNSAGTLHIYPQIADYVVAVFPIIYLLLALLLLMRIKTSRQFFWTTLSFIISSYLLQFIDLIPNQRALPVVLLLIPLFLLFTVCLTLLWKNILLKRRPKTSLFLLGIFILDVFVVKAESSNNLNGIMGIYVSFGEFLNKITQYKLNIFFLDYGSFVIIFLNVLNTLIALLILLIYQNILGFSRKKKK